MIMDSQGQKRLELILAEFSASSPQKFKPTRVGGIKWGQGNWFIGTGSNPRALTWQDHAEDFDAYNTAFLYTSWGQDDSG